MIHINQVRIPRWLMSFFAMILAFQLSACSDKESEQRNAFIDYLQNTVMRGGSKIPTLSENQKQKLGHYADDYAILVTFSQNFHHLINVSINPLFTTLSHIKTAADYIIQRNQLCRISGVLDLASQQIQYAQVQVENAHAALKYPYDLKVVLDAVYNKVITEPMNLVTPMFPMVTALTQDLIQVGDFLQSLGTDAYVSKQGVQLKTQAQVAQYNQLMSNIEVKSQVLREAQRHYEFMIQE